MQAAVHVEQGIGGADHLEDRRELRRLALRTHQREQVEGAARLAARPAEDREEAQRLPEAAEGEGAVGGVGGQVAGTFAEESLDLLARSQLEVRISEDITDMHQALILQGWRDLTQALAPGTVAPETVPHLVNEAELWARRGAVLRTGDLRVYRFYALKAGDPVS